ncbi:Uncharacterised protein at_DN2003 [Pycnogonum litorale]
MKFRATYGPSYAPTQKTIYSINAKFMNTDFVTHSVSSSGHTTSRSEDNMQGRQDAYNFSQTRSICQASTNSIKRIMKSITEPVEVNLSEYRRLSGWEHNFGY